MNGVVNMPVIPPVARMLGVGFGPSNLALAIALAETGVIRDCVFAERQQQFGWHEAMKLPDADMQISFMKDLVTPRNPMSPYSFLNYLRERGRLETFINLRNFYPTRHEFGDYLKWVADAFAANTIYDFTVKAVDAVEHNGTMLLCATGVNSEGSERRIISENLCFATGHRMNIPEFVQPHYGARAFHTSEFLPRMTAVKSDLDRLGRAPRILVVGAGQSAAETALYCSDHFPHAQVDWCFRQFALRPMDDSHFVNEIFRGDMVDRWFDKSPEGRAQFRQDFHHANYSAIDGSLIEKIYAARYNRDVENRPFVNIRNLTELVSMVGDGAGVRAGLRNVETGETAQASYDVVILGTGYGEENFSPMLENIRDYLCFDDDGALCVDRTYRVQTRRGLDAGIFSLGSNERTHGIGDTLLSNVAIRTEPLVRAIFGQSGEQRVAPTPALSLASQKGLTA